MRKSPRVRDARFLTGNRGGSKISGAAGVRFVWFANGNGREGGGVEEKKEKSQRVQRVQYFKHFILYSFCVSFCFVLFIVSRRTQRVLTTTCAGTRIYLYNADRYHV